MGSILAPVRSTKILIALALVAAETATLTPTASAESSDCRPGAGGFGMAVGADWGAAQAWNCAGASFHTHDEEASVTLWAGFASLTA